MTTSTPPVLVVEDENLVRLYVVTLLEDAGIPALEACDSDGALAMLAAHPEIAIVLTDVNMPGRIDGLELIQEIRRDHPALHCIVVSGKTSQAEALAAGAVGYIPKPYLPQALLAAVEATMRDCVAHHPANP